MASDVKWIKIVTGIFDDDKILLIESMPDKYAIIVCWFKLLCLAGKQNNQGVFLMNNRIAYTDEMLSTIFRMPVNTVRLALQTFEQFGMVEIIDGVITIPNWDKHQSLDAYERKKERDRLYQAERRANQKAIVEKSSDTSPDTSPDVASQIRLDKIRLEGDKNIKASDDAEEPPSPSIPYEKIKNLYNEICKSFSKCNVMSDARKKAVKARISSGYTVDHFKTLFTKAEASSFLKGRNDRNWKASFDWLIKDANMAKVLDGNYDDRGASAGYGHGPQDYGNPEDFYR